MTVIDSRRLTFWFLAGLRFFFFFSSQCIVLHGILPYYATRAAAGMPRNGSNLSAIRRGRVDNSALVEILSNSIFCASFLQLISLPSSSKRHHERNCTPCLPQNLLFLNQIFYPSYISLTLSRSVVLSFPSSLAATVTSCFRQVLSLLNKN